MSEEIKNTTATEAQSTETATEGTMPEVTPEELAAAQSDGEATETTEPTATDTEADADDTDAEDDSEEGTEENA